MSATTEKFAATLLDAGDDVTAPRYRIEATPTLPAFLLWLNAENQIGIRTVGSYDTREAKCEPAPLTINRIPWNVQMFTEPFAVDDWRALRSSSDPNGYHALTMYRADVAFDTSEASWSARERCAAILLAQVKRFADEHPEALVMGKAHRIHAAIRTRTEEIEAHERRAADLRAECERIKAGEPLDLYARGDRYYYAKPRTEKD